MKKSYLMIAAAAALFEACSSNDTFKEISNEKVLIGFETFHEKATRAAVSAGSDLTSANGGFGVFGYNHEDNRAVSAGSINMTTTGTSNVFNNVKVWYEDASTQTKGFTYDVPKYWNKNKYYTFFAYAPWNATTVTLAEATGKFTRTDVQSLQSTNAATPTTVTVGTNSRDKYTDAVETSAIDYLFAVCVPQQKYAATNQTTYTGYQKTVGFTFSHILSKLNVTVKAKNESTGHQYSGVKDIQVTSLNIENLPNVTANVTYTQTATDGVAGTFSPANYTTTLNIIGGTNALTAGPLYVLDGGVNGTPVTVPTTYIDQAFHYWVAPNTPTGTDHDSYKLNINYTINYVDNISDSFTRTIDLSNESAAFTAMAQNNIYNITITIGLDQIYFNVDAINGWATPQDTDVEIE